MNLSQVDVLLDAAGRDEPVDADVTLLAQPVGAILSLQVVRRVPVGIKDDNDIGAC